MNVKKDPFNVYAIYDGEVLYALTNEHTLGSRIYLKVDLPNVKGTFVYGYLDKILINPGDTIRAGDILAYCGKPPEGILTEGVLLPTLFLGFIPKDSRKQNINFGIDPTSLVGEAECSPCNFYINSSYKASRKGLEFGQEVLREEA